MFNISDHVKIKSFDDMPAGFKSRAMCKLCGKDAVIVDRLASEAIGKTIYLLKVEGNDTVSSVHFTEDCFEAVKQKPEFAFEIEELNGVVLVRFFEDGIEIMKNHGHIIHDGALGVIQAASYALKSMLCRMDDQGVYRKIGESL